MTDLRQRLKIPAGRLDEINTVLMNPDSKVINQFLEVVARYGTPEEINTQARQARKLENLLRRVAETRPDYLADLEWLIEQRDRRAFISVGDYRRKVHGEAAAGMTFADDYAVTLEISAMQYFPWLRVIAERAIDKGMLMPGPIETSSTRPSANCKRSMISSLRDLRIPPRKKKATLLNKK